MSWTALAFALPVLLAGAWYLTAPGPKLAEAEGQRAAAVRARLRRVNGGVLIVSSLCLCVVISRAVALRDGGTLDLALPVASLLLVPLLVAMLVLAWLDMRLTRRLRQRMMGTVARDAAARWERELASRGLAVLLVCTLLGCDDPAPPAAPQSLVQQKIDTAREQVEKERRPQQLDTMDLAVGDVTLSLMVADEDAERQKGLMHRRKMAADEGMIFAFPEARPRNFWMQNTPLPLDIIYLDARGTVLNVGEGRPFSTGRVNSAGPAKWVIELNRGRAAEVGLRVGTRLAPEKLPAAVE